MPKPGKEKLEDAGPLSASLSPGNVSNLLVGDPSTAIVETATAAVRIAAEIASLKVTGSTKQQQQQLRSLPYQGHLQLHQQQQQ